MNPIKEQLLPKEFLGFKKVWSTKSLQSMYGILLVKGLKQSGEGYKIIYNIYDVTWNTIKTIIGKR